MYGPKRINVHQCWSLKFLYEQKFLRFRCFYTLMDLSWQGWQDYLANTFICHSLRQLFVCVAGWLLRLLRSMKGGACVRLPLTKHYNNYVLSLLIACPVSVWRCVVHVRNIINGMSLRFLGLPFQATLAVAVSPPSPWQPSKQRQRIVRRWFFSTVPFSQHIGWWCKSPLLTSI